MAAKPRIIILLIGCLNISLLISGCNGGRIFPSPSIMASEPSPSQTTIATPIPLLTPAPSLQSTSALGELPVITQSIVLNGHTDAVTHLSWSPDGSLLATSCGDISSSDNTIQVWHPDGTLAFTLTGHTQPVTGLSWSPDGKILATSSLDGTIRLWQSDGSLIRVLEGHAGRVFAVAWSPDGKTLASASIVEYQNPTVQLWDQNGKIINTLSTSYSGGKFYNLSWSPDGQYLVGGAIDYKLWRSDGTQVFWLGKATPGTPAWGMAWSPDSRLWAVGDESGYIKIFSNQGEQVASIQDQSAINSLAWSSDGKKMASARTLWLADGKAANKLAGQSPYVNSIAWSPGGKFFVSGGSDSLVRVWSADGEPLGTLSGHTGEIRAVAWSPDGKILASGSADKTIRLWIFKSSN